MIRPVVLWGITPKQRAAETGMSQRTIYYRANLFDAAGMASLLPAEPPPPIPKQDKRALPPPIRQEIVDLRAEYPAFRPHEIATTGEVEWYVIIRTDPPARRRKGRGRIVLIQPPLWANASQG